MARAIHPIPPPIIATFGRFVFTSGKLSEGTRPVPEQWRHLSI